MDLPFGVRCYWTGGGGTLGRRGRSPVPGWNCGTVPHAPTANTAALAARLSQSSYREPAGRRGIPSPEKAQLGAEIQEAPDSRSAPGESPGQSLGSLRGQVPGSRVPPGAECAAPPPGSRWGGPRRLGQQLLLPYKAGAGPRRGRGCGRSTSSSAILAVRGWPGSAEAAGTQERTEPAMGKSASKQFNNEVLIAHNEYRKQHGVPPLKLCKKLNQEAQQYSEALASTRILKHSPESSRGQCGENLAWASYDQTGKEVADRWYSEIKNYNFQQPGFNSGTGHFTAMVWKNTKKMGVGKASASDGSSFVVARYFPAGNVVNQGFFEENVLPPKK